MSRENDPRYTEDSNRGTCKWEAWDMPAVAHLKRGKLGAKARHIFTHGHCHSFALAVCELLPGARALFANDGDHVVAALPDGRIVDADGLVIGLEIGREVPDDWDWLADWYKIPRTTEALPFAQTMLASVGAL